MTVLGWILLLLFLSAAAIGGYYYLRRPQRRDDTPNQSYIDALRALLDGNHTLAFLKLKETVTTDSNNVDAYIRLAGLLRQRGMHSKSLQLSMDLSTRLNVDPVDRVKILYNLVEDHRANGKLEAAEHFLKELSHMPNQKGTASKMLVELYEKSERWEDAFKAGSDYLDATRNRDKSSLAKFKLRVAKKLLADGEHHKARVEYKEALKLDPACADAVVGLGDAYDQEARLEDAVKSWREIIEVNPRKAELVFGRLKKALFDLGQFGEIEDLYLKVIEKDKQNLAALTGLATLAEKKGETLQAEEIYLQVLDAKPDYRPALVGLLKLYREEKKYNEAAQVLSRTVETLHPADKLSI